MTVSTDSVQLPRSNGPTIRYFEDVRYWRGAAEVRETLDAPVIVLNTINEMPSAANILASKGKSALREHLRSAVKLPPLGSQARAELSRRVQEDIDWWQAELSEGGLDPAEAEKDDQGRFSEAERIIIGWLARGVLPEDEQERCFELAWPFALRQVSEMAEIMYPGMSDGRAASEEVYSYRVRRWLDAHKPFASHDWLPRAELFSAFSNWSLADNGTKPGKPNDLYEALEELGYRDAKRNRGTRGFLAPLRMAG